MRESWLCVMKPTFRKWVTSMEGVDKLELKTDDLPTPGEGEVLVKVHAVSVNYRDIEGLSFLFRLRSLPNEQR
jgi:NADPH:quinone reductase-like Zn-dependent oxidoreductase